MADTTTKEHRGALRRAGRERTLQDLRDGRRQRSVKLSKQGYQRHAKHRNGGLD